MRMPSLAGAVRPVAGLATLLLPAALTAQAPTLRDLSAGTSVGTFAPLVDVVELPGGATLIGEVGGAIWRLPAGAAKAERMPLTGGSPDLAGLSWAGGDSAWIWSTRAIQAYPLPLSGKIGPAVGTAPEGIMMMMAGGANRRAGADATGRIYQPQQGGTNETRLVSAGNGGGRNEAGLSGEAINRVNVGPGGIEPMKIFQPADAWVVRPDGMVGVVRHTPYRVEWYRGGTLVKEGLTAAWTPVPTTVADSLEQVRLVTQGMSRMPMINGMGGSPPPFTMAKEKPPFIARSIRLATDGSIWVQLSTAAGSGGAVWDHWGEDGRHLDRVRLPEGSLALGFGAANVWVMRGGELYRTPLTKL